MAHTIPTDTQPTAAPRHLLEMAGAGDMAAFYAQARMLPTSEHADVALIRSHLAYWGGRTLANRAAVRASRGHSYRIALGGRHEAGDLIVRIVDHMDHRAGVVGYHEAAR